MLNKTPMILRTSTGTKVVLQRSIAGWQGEIALATDVGHLFYCTATESPFIPLQTLPMAVCHDDNVVCHNDEVVYTV